MSGTANHNEQTDARLVAYVDGVLPEDERIVLAQSLADDPALAQRLALLERGNRDFGAAFTPLLEAAPDTRMRDMLGDLIDDAQESAPSSADNVVPLPGKSRSMWSGAARMATAAALALAVFSGGLYTGWQTGDTPVAQQPKTGWLQVVAGYISLYNKQTLDGLPATRTAQDKSLARAAQAIGLPLTFDRAAIDTLAFKGSQVLQLKGKPLVQIAYLHNNETPVALCIIKSKKPASAQKTAQHLGLNIVHWVAGGHGYMLIGKMPKKQLQKIASPLLAKFS